MPKRDSSTRPHHDYFFTPKNPIFPIPALPRSFWPHDSISLPPAIQSPTFWLPTWSFPHLNSPQLLYAPWPNPQWRYPKARDAPGPYSRGTHLAGSYALRNSTQELSSQWGSYQQTCPRCNYPQPPPPQFTSCSSTAQTISLQAESSQAESSQVKCPQRLVAQPPLPPPDSCPSKAQTTSLQVASSKPECPQQSVLQTPLPPPTFYPSTTQTISSQAAYSQPQCLQWSIPQPPSSQLEYIGVHMHPDRVKQLELAFQDTLSTKVKVKPKKRKKKTQKKKAIPSPQVDSMSSKELDSHITPLHASIHALANFRIAPTSVRRPITPASLWCGNASTSLLSQKTTNPPQAQETLALLRPQDAITSLPLSATLTLNYEAIMPPPKKLKFSFPTTFASGAPSIAPSDLPLSPNYLQLFMPISAF